MSLFVILFLVYVIIFLLSGFICFRLYKRFYQSGTDDHASSDPVQYARSSEPPATPLCNKTYTSPCLTCDKVYDPNNCSACTLPRMRPLKPAVE